MERKIVLMATLGFLFLAIFATQSITSVRAETGTGSTVEPPALPEAPGLPKWFVDGNGTVFQITNSSYLNVTLTSSEYVHVFLESVPRMVSYSIESLSSANSTVLSLSGFVPSTTYYRYQDGNLTESFTTDSAGGYTYLQDISNRHHIFVVENMTTIYIQPDGTVYSDTGQPVPISKSEVGGIYTYTFTGNIYEPIIVQRDNIVIDGNGYTLEGPGSGYGFYLIRISNVTLKNVTIKGWTTGIVLSYFSSYNSISGNNITNNYNCGIVLLYSSYNSISGNNIRANEYYGIYLGSSSYNSITANNITNSRWGIMLSLSSYNSISGNNITNNDSGISLSWSSDNSISGNNITNNLHGIWLSPNNVLRGNSLANNKYNFCVGGGKLTDFINDVDVSNTVDGKPICYWISKRDMTVPLDAGYVALVNCTRITVQNLNLTKNWQGALLAFTSNSTITKNNITNNYYGIMLLSSSYNSISGNNVTDRNTHGIYLSGSSYNSISGNNIRANLPHGIYLTDSSSNSISGNNIENNWLGIYLYSSSNNSISGNNIITHAINGILLSYSSSYNSISGNNIKYAYYGVQFNYCSNNSISGSNITNNVLGIYIVTASNNTVYHNNFIYNTKQVYDYYSDSINTWDDGYPSGGNYWSDYVGQDYYRGPNQDEIGSDGIGDTPYIIDGKNRDRYPFTRESGWAKIQYQITFGQSGVGSDFTGTVVIIDGINYGVGNLPVSFWWDEGSTHTFAFQTPLVAAPNATQYVWTSTTGLSAQQGETITVSASGSIVGNYKTQYYLTVTSPYDITVGGGWYDEGETAYATLLVGLDYVNEVAYGFVGWTGDASGLDLTSNPITMDAPKTATAKWEASTVYGAEYVKTIGFWRRNVRVWYLWELQLTGAKTSAGWNAYTDMTEDELLAYLRFIDNYSDYFRGKIVRDNNGDGTITNLEILENAYNFVKPPQGPGEKTPFLKAEEQLFLVWLNLARKAFFWNTGLSQETLYVYSQYNFESEYGLTTIGEAIKFCEAQLLKPDGDYEAARAICQSINETQGIIWGT